ncbi:MAG: leucine-rich repeat domain-containing protein [Clostridiales bacterium]|nr:leucine-rich repeat domain-containing protein [Clostridiales bacterium]
MTDHKTKLLALLLAAMLALPAPGVAFAEAPDAAPAGGDVKVPTLLQADLGNGEDIRELFEDEALYNAVRENIGVADGLPLTLDGVQNMKSLLADSLNITSLKGLEHLTNLTVLYLGDNQITDIKPLAGLTQLESLYLEGNQLTDISPLENLTQLELLILDGNQLTNISPLKDLTGLTSLSLVGNQLTDISALEDLTELVSLYLTDNQITDISSLKGLTNLEELSLDGNQLTSISALKDLTKLNFLYLADNQLTDITDLKGLTELTLLSLDDNRLTDISPLKDLTGLEVLYLADNNLSDVSDLSGMVNLFDLTLSGNPLTAEHLESVLPEEFKGNVEGGFEQWLEETLHGSTPPDDGGEDKPTRRDNDDSDYYGVEKWNEVKRQIADADEGDTIKVSGTGLPYFPSSVARELKGKNVSLEVRKNGVTYTVNGLEIGEIDKIWYEFENIEEQLLTAEPEDKADEQKPEQAETKPNPATGR